MRHGGDLRGSSYNRRRRKQWLLNTFGTGRSCPCHWCGKRLTYKTLTADRLLPGEEGGRYIRSNLVPACLRCNQQRSNRTRYQVKLRQTTRRRGDYCLKEFRAITRREE